MKGILGPEGTGNRRIRLIPTSVPGNSPVVSHQISTENAAFRSVAPLLKQNRNRADRSHIAIRFSLLVRKVAHKSPARTNGDERHFRSPARYLFKSGKEPRASSKRSNYQAILLPLFSGIQRCLVGITSSCGIPERESGRFVLIHLPPSKSIRVKGSFMRLDYTA